MATDTYPESLLPKLRFEPNWEHEENTETTRFLAGNSRTRLLTDSPEYNYKCFIDFTTRDQIRIFEAFYAHKCNYGSTAININIPTAQSRSQQVEARIINVKKRRGFNADGQSWMFDLIVENYTPMSEADLDAFLPTP